MANLAEAQCVFINGLPGSGKTTYARRFVAGRREWLNLDVDVLRGQLGIAASDFAAAGVEVRPLALALLETQLSLGRNVVFPQLFFEPEESADFETAARAAGACITRFMLHVDAEECWRRVSRRGAEAAAGSPDRGIQELIEAKGGLAELARMRARLDCWLDVADPPLAVTSYDEFVDQLTPALASR